MRLISLHCDESGICKRLSKAKKEPGLFEEGQNYNHLFSNSLGEHRETIMPYKARDLFWNFCLIFCLHNWEAVLENCVKWEIQHLSNAINLLILCVCVCAREKRFTHSAKSCATACLGETLLFHVAFVSCSWNPLHSAQGKVNSVFLRISRYVR